MNKKDFIEFFGVEDKNEVAKLYEKYTLTEFGISSWTDEFYSPNIWNELLKMKKSLGVEIETYGISAQSEKRAILFKGDYEVEFPLKLLSIKNLSKFKSLAHKDYLGALMSLGIKREKLGDLVVKGDQCYFLTFEDMAKIIFHELKTVGNNPVEVQYLDKIEIEIEFEKVLVTISSERLDSLVGAVTKQSRESAVKSIERGEVLVNYEIQKDKSLKLQKDDVISIKGYGKFKYIEVLGNTKKDKKRIEIKKFV